MPGEGEKPGMPPLPGERPPPGLEETEPFKKEFETEPGFPEEPGMHPAPKAPEEMPEEPAGPAFGAPPGRPHAAAPPAYMPTPSGAGRDIELLNAKLDAIKAMLENINQRLTTIERIAKSTEHETYARY